MNKYYTYRQNNSGGRFTDPAVSVIVEALTLDEANANTEPHFTLCGGSGLYADYDNCGCCPCCGHRWSEPWDDKGETAEQILEELIGDPPFKYEKQTPQRALIKRDRSIIFDDDVKPYIESQITK